MSDAVKGAIGAVCLLVVLAIVFVICMNKKNRARAKVLDNREEELNQKLKELESENKKLNQQQQQADGERLQLQAEIQREEATLINKLSDEDKAQVDLLNKEIGQICDAKLIEEEALLNKLQHKETLTAIESAKIATLLLGDDAAVRAEQQEAQLTRRMADREARRHRLTEQGGIKAAQEVTELDEEAGAEAVILDKLRKGEDLTDEEERIMSSHQTTIDKVSTLTSAQDVTKREALSKRLAERQMKRELLKKKQREAEAAGAVVEAPVAEALEALELQGKKEGVMLEKMNSGEALDEGEQKMVQEAAEEYERAVLAKAEETTRKLESRLAQSKTSKQDALAKRIEERKRKKEGLEQKKAKISRQTTADAKTLQDIQAKKLKLGSVLSRMKKTGDKMAKNEREAKRVHAEAEATLQKVNIRVDADAAEQKAKTLRRRLARKNRKKEKNIEV